MSRHNAMSNVYGGNHTELKLNVSNKLSHDV